MSSSTEISYRTGNETLIKVLENAGSRLHGLLKKQGRLEAGALRIAVVGGGSMDPSNERGRQLVADMAHRSFTAALDLDAAGLIPT